MSDITDFTDNGQEPSVADFAVDSGTKDATVNAQSSRNLAANAALAGSAPDDTLDTYHQIYSGLNAEGQSKLADQLLTQVKNSEFDSARKSLIDILNNPNISDDVKMKATHAVYDKQNPMYKVRNIVSYKAIQADSPGESKEAESARVNLAAVVPKMNDDKKAEQAWYNMTVGYRTPSTSGKVSYLIRSLLPYLSSYKTVKELDVVNPDHGIKNFFKGMILAGNAKQEVRDAIASMPINERLKTLDQLRQVIKDHSGIPMVDEGDFETAQELDNLLSYNGDTQHENNLGNIGSLLDLTLIGGVPKRVAKVVKGIKDLTEVVGTTSRAAKEFNTWGKMADNWSRDSVRSEVQPASTAMNLKDTNPAKFRAAHDIVAADVTGKSAEALYGTSRTDAVSHDLTPEVGHADLSVKQKVPNPDMYDALKNAPDPALENWYKDEAAHSYTQKEKASARSNIVNDYHEAIAIPERKEMFQIFDENIKDMEDGVHIRGTYGPENGFSDPETAIELAKFAWRKQGIPDEAIKLLKRDGGRYIEVDPAEEIANRKLLTNNASGESAASAEAIGRLGQEKAAGQTRAIIRADGTVEPLIGADRVDAVARKGEVIVQRGIGKDKWTVLHAGDGVSDTLAQGKINRAKSALEDVHLNESGGGGDGATGFGEYNLYDPNDPHFPVVQESGDYLLGIDWHAKLGSDDVSEWSHLPSKTYFFGRTRPWTSGRGGTLMQHALDPNSVIDKTIVNAFSRAVDRSSGLEKALYAHAKDFVDKVSQLNINERGEIADIIKEANKNSKWPDYSYLKANGMTAKQVDALKSWRYANDQLWYLNNWDASRRLSSKGWMHYINKDFDSHLFVRPYKNAARVKPGTAVFDVASGQVRHLSRQEIEDIYANGGKVAETLSPMLTDEVMAGVSHTEDVPKHIVIENEAADTAYLSKIKESDKVLSYREGHYHVEYKDPHFIVKVLRGTAKADGTPGPVIAHIPVGTAGTVKEAENAVKRFGQVDGGEYYHRPDLNSDVYPDKDGSWGLHEASGMSTQRVRGKRLMDTSSNVLNNDMNHIVGPFDAMIKSIRSVSRKVPMRDVLEATRTRAIKDYADYFPKERGQPRMPRNLKEVGWTGEVGTPDPKMLAQARIITQYVNTMEYGIIDAFDNGTKAMFNTLAEQLGGLGFERGEKAARWFADKGINGIGKKATYTYYIATNPARQLLVQSAQIALLAADNPKFFFSGGLSKNAGYLLWRSLGLEHQTFWEKLIGKDAKQLDAYFNAFKKSGLTASVDKQSIIRGNMADMGDVLEASLQDAAGDLPTRAMHKASYASKWALDKARKVGFDAGEINQLTHAWASSYNKAERLGKDMSNPSVLADVHGEARNYTSNMNRSGDMPYSENALRLGLQYQQQSHKMLLTMITNRQIPVATKAKMWATLSAFFGVPGATALWSIWPKSVPTNTEARKAIEFGMVSSVFNKFASMITGDDTAVDFSSLSPVNMYGTMNVIHNVFTTQLGEALGNTPAGSLFFGGNPRLTNFFKDAAKYFNLIEDDKETPTTFSQVAKDFASISSGMSNYFKARYMWEHGKKISSYSGNVTDPNVTKTEALAQFFGLPPQAETELRNVRTDLYHGSEEHKQDVKKWFNDYYQKVASLDPNDPNYVPQLLYQKRVYTEAMRVFGNYDEVTKSIIDKELKRKAESGDGAMYSSLLYAHNYMTEDQIDSYVDRLTMPDEQKAQWKKNFHFIYSIESADQNKGDK